MSRLRLDVYIVFITCLLICHCHGLMEDYLKIDAEFDKEYVGTVSLDNSVAYEFNLTSALLKDNVVRVHASSVNATDEFPVLVVVKQRNAVFSFQVPIIISSLVAYNNVSRTLCPLLQSMYSSQPIVIEISSFIKDPKVIHYTFRAELHKNFILSLNQVTQTTFTPAEPVYFMFKYPENVESVTVNTHSSDKICMVFSVQSLDCPVSDLLGNVQYAGIYQTVTTLGVISADIQRYPTGFFVVLVLKPTDYECARLEQIVPRPNHRFRISNSSSRVKNVTIEVVPTLAVHQYYLPMFGAIGFYTLFYIFAGIFTCIYHAYDKKKNLYMSDPHFHCQVGGRLVACLTHLDQLSLPPRTTTPITIIADITSVSSGVVTSHSAHSVTNVSSQCALVSENTWTTGHPPVNYGSAPTSRAIRRIPHAFNWMHSPSQPTPSTSNPVLPSLESHEWFSSSDKDELDSEQGRSSIGQTPVGSVSQLATQPTSSIPPSAAGTMTPIHHRSTSVEVIPGDTSEIGDDPVSEDSTVRDNRSLYVADLSKKQYTTLNRKYMLFSWYLFIISVFYVLPVAQLVMTYQRAVVETGNEDLCYYNFKCTRSLWVFTAFNNVISNAGYVMLGLLFLFITARRDILHRRSRGMHMKYLDEHGIPQHYGLFYAMGLALTMEGIMSGCYHLCPNLSNFQFDTAYMYILAMLIMLKIYQTRHPDVNASAHSAYMVMALVILLGVVGVLYGGQTFWVVFTFCFLLMSVGLTIEIYYVGRWNIDLCLPRRLYGLIEANGIHCLRPLYCERMALLLVANCVNCGLAFYGLFSLPNDFSTFLLTIFMTNLLMYTLFYMIMKLRHRERFLLLPLVYITIGFITWCFAMYFFTRRTTTWEISPAQSRALNQDCILLDFYDAHDVWHFLSSTSMFFAFLFLINLDDDLFDTPRSQIPVF